MAREQIVAAMTETWPFVGREGEVAAFREWLGRADAHAFLLYGPAGVGKTRLADACREAAAATGLTTMRLVATRAAAALPLGAVAPLLPVDVDASVAPAELLARTDEELAERAGDGRVLVMVDDAHLLDGSSAVLLGQLAEAGHVLLLATIRAGAEAPDAVAGWWRDERTVRVDLQDLGPEATAQVLERALGGPVGRDAAHRLHRASDGNPLLLRELVLEADRTGALDDASGTWQVRDALPPSRRLDDLLADRLDPLDPAQRQVLEVLATCGPMTAAEIGDVDAAVLEDLERRDLVRSHIDGRRLQVGLAHPVLGEVVRSQLTALRRRALVLEAADRVERLGALRRDDAFRIATWRLDAGGTPDPELLLQATHVARYAHDFAAVERLARVLKALAPSTEASVLLGEALYELGSFEEAEAVLAEPAAPGSDPAVVVQQATVRTKNLQWGLSDWPGALRVVREAEAVAPPEHADELRAEEASVRMFSGAPQEAIDLLEPLVPEIDRVRVLRALVLSPTLASVGRTAEAVEVAEAGYREHVALVDVQGLAHPGTHVVNQAFALVEAGRFAEAEVLATLGHGVALDERVPIAQIWFAMLLARSTILRGQAEESLEWSQEAASTARLHRFAGPLRIALSALATAAAMLGDAAGAKRAAGEIEDLPPYGFLHHDQVLGGAWAAWADGDPERARTVLVEEAEAAERSSNRVTASWLWHDAARFGAKRVGERLLALAASTDSALVSARAAHVVAVEADDAAGLESAAAGFEGLAADLLAAEAWSAAAEARRRHGDGRGAAAAQRRADALAAASPGVRTPGLSRSVSVVPLTPREREVADLAARGLSAPDIAARLFLSTRTVENHLQKAYAKLGVRNRRELADTLGPG